MPAAGGLLAGILVYSIAPDADGAGTGALIDAYHNKAGRIPLRVAAVKFLASVVTLGTGGSAGQEGPMAQIGGGLQGLEPGWVSNPGSYVLVGMGAFFAGAAKAPLAGLIMVCEITGNYGQLPPLLIATTVHLALSRRWSLYRSQRLNKFSTPVHETSLRKDVFRGAPLSSVLPRQGKEPDVLQADLKLADALATIPDLAQEIYPVADTGGTLIGMMPAQTLHHGLSE